MNLALLELGFRPTTYSATGEDVFSKKTFGRFTHEFNIFPDGKLVINCFESSGCRTVTSDEVLKNHNQLHTEAEELMKKLKEMGYG